MAESKFIIETDVPNDSIDPKDKIDVKITKVKPSNDAELKVHIEGKNIDNSVVNAIRRTILLSIPIYGFHRSNINIESDKSHNMYNNDMIYCQLETLPIFDIPNYFDLENPEVFLPTPVMKKVFGYFVKEAHVDDDSNPYKIDPSKKMFKVEMGINLKNLTGVDKFVSTHDAVLKIDGKVSDSYLKRKPISILVLKPGEELYLRAEANLGIAKLYASYEATTNVIMRELSSSKYELEYETLGQLSKEVIFTKACQILSKKLANLHGFIESQYKSEPDNDSSVEIELYGEEDTIGNLVTTALQKSEYVQSAGYIVPHPYHDLVKIQYKLLPNAKMGPVKLLKNIIDYLIQLMDTIGNVFQKSK
jgi:DNA-directed RNA polymerase subunit L